MFILFLQVNFELIYSYNLLIILSKLTLSALQPIFVLFANCTDSDETAHNEPSHQDLHCLPFCFEGLIEMRFYGQVNSLGLCRARSVYLTPLFLDRLSPLCE